MAGSYVCHSFLNESNMKKSIIVALFLGSTLGIQAQSMDFGLTAGYLNASIRVKADGISLSDSESGFYVGAVADFGITENFHIQPELAYASVNEGEAIFLPVVGKFYVTDKLNLQAGPQFVFSLEDLPEDFSAVEIDLAAGLGFDITEHFFVEGRYSFQLNNSYTGSEDVTIKGNYLNLGIGYTF